MYEVAVLLSTYNGEKYIKEQLNSILQQKEVDIQIYIRDDSSSDNTVHIIRQMQKKHSNIHLTIGENMGFEKSFMELVYTCPKAEYYAFADQDDVWLDEKLIQGIRTMKDHEAVPQLYYSYMTQVNSQLDVMKEQQPQHPILSKTLCLFQHFVQGSTIIYNHSLQQYVCKYHIQQKIAHDIWIPILANYLGELHYDENSYILYRIHNCAVTANMKKSYWRKLLGRIFSNEMEINPAVELVKGYRDNIAKEDFEFVFKTAMYAQSIKSRLSMVFDKRVVKLSAKGKIMLKMAFLFGRIQKYKE